MAPEHQADEGRSVPVFALVGNPNSGKTTLFNALTGLRQKTGNYPGVTVERKEGIAYTQHGDKIRILDLPGSYSLNARSPDEQILLDALVGRIEGEPLPDGVICCIDASNRERNLFLASQVLELGRPTVLVLNMMDVAESRGMKIDTAKLEESLGVPVIPTVAHKGKGLVDVRLSLSRNDLPAGRRNVEIPAFLRPAIQEMAPILRRNGHRDPQTAEAEAYLLLSGESHLLRTSPESTRARLWHQKLDREYPGWRSQLITSRYAWIGDLCRDALRRFNPGKPSFSDRVDRFLLHPAGGFAALILVFSILFYSIFKLATPLMDAVEGLVGWFSERVAAVMPPGEVQSLVVDGVLGGVGAVVVFLPQIMILFFFIAMLESTGYMARAAFLLDRVMSRVGLHGRSFVPLLSSYACAVPGIMATRTIESPKDRLITILVAPFMTCSARLPVYLVMIAALLPTGPGHAWTKSLLMLGLYFLGTMTALGFAWFFRKTLMRGASPNMVMELPAYKMPRWGSVVREMWDRAWIFLRRAGTVIFALSIILWFLMSYPKAGSEMTAASEPAERSEVTESEIQTTDAGLAPRQLEESFAGRLGSWVEPVFAPLGYDWKITIGVIASFAAREVFVSTLAIAYAVDESDESSLLDRIRNATHPDGTPVYTPLTCLSILVFFVFALQCISTIAVVKRETQSWRWPVFQFAYMFAFAWLASFIVYQGGQLLGFQ